jgi:hypothetical protein
VCDRHRLAEREAVQAHAEIVEMRVALTAEPGDRAQLVVLPRRVARVHDEPAARLRDAVAQLRLSHGSGGYSRL